MRCINLRLTYLLTYCSVLAEFALSVYISLLTILCQVLRRGAVLPRGADINIRGWQSVEPWTPPVSQQPRRPVLWRRRWRHFRVGARRRHPWQLAPRDVVQWRFQRISQHPTPLLVSVISDNNWSVLFLEIGRVMFLHWLGLVLRMGDHWPLVVTSHRGRLTHPGHPSVGRRNEYWQYSPPSLGKKKMSSA